MSSRVKEDERNEKIIRGLLKLPANRRCINCNNLGPQYVCTNFWTFVCTNCSGAHREFTHRVKSVSMAKFTSQEVTALQEGGNERAREIYFREWDSQRNSYPESSDTDKLRNFIKHVYVDRRYTGERNSDRPPRMKDDREETSERGRPEFSRGGSGSGSPPVKFSYGERSPGDSQGDSRRNARYFEVVDDRRRDDRGNRTPVQRFEDRRLSDVVKPDSGSSPDYRQQSPDVASPSVAVRPVRDILGDSAPPLRVGEPPKPNGIKAIDPPAKTQRSSSLSSLPSADDKPTQVTVTKAVSLIDFGTDPEPSVSVPAPPVVPPQDSSASVSGGDWASFDAFNQQKAPAASNANPLEAGLAQLSMSDPPAPVASNVPAAANPTTKANDAVQLAALFDAPAVPNNLGPQQVNAFGSSSVPHVPQHVNSFGSPPAPQGPQQVNAFGSPPAPQGPQQVNAFGSPSAPQGPHVLSTFGSSTAPHSSQTNIPVPSGHLAPIATKPPQDTNAGGLGQPSSAGRKPLPEDFFTSLYPHAAPAMPMWHRAPHYGMGYAMPYPPGAMTMQPMQPMQGALYTQPARPANPFDLGSETVQSPTYSSMPPAQGAAPSMGGQPTLLRNSSFGTPQRAMPPQQLYQQLPYAATMPQNQYMMQHVPANMMQQMPMQHMPNNMQQMMMQQGVRGPANARPGFSNPAMEPHAGPQFSHQNAPTSFGSGGSVGGNPFG